MLKNYKKLNPILREFIIYLNKVSTENIINDHINEFNSIFNWSYYRQFPYVNLWYSSLFRNEKFKNLTVVKDNIITIRDKTFYAILKKDVTWVKDYKDKVDMLGPWDKRAVIYSSSLLTKDERVAWLNCYFTSTDILERSIAKFLN